MFDKEIKIEYSGKETSPLNGRDKRGTKFTFTTQKKINTNNCYKLLFFTCY